MNNALKSRSVLRRDEQISSELVTVTPEIAKAWLDRNTNNRRPSRQVIAKYARDMINDSWQLTGDAIRFDVNNNIIDGQHRLMACIEANKSFDTLVIYKLAPEAQKVIDTGKSRSAADALSLDGFHYSHLLAATCRAILDIKVGGSRAGRQGWSTAEVYETLERHKDLPGCVRIVAMEKCPPRISKTQLCLVAYIGGIVQKEQDAAQQFISVFATGKPAYDGCPAHAARERLLRSAIDKVAKDAAGRAIRHAWNLFRRGEKVSHLKIPKEAPFDDLDVSLL